jgi:cob(I)alamin adenosyltransferase
MKIYTRKGDDGSTGLLYGGRVAKDDVRTEVYGTIDEAVSAIGMARAAGLVEPAEAIAVRLQREMFVVGAQLATSTDNQHKLTAGVSRVDVSMTRRAEADIDELLAEHPLPQEFVLPGETAASAALDLGRAILRRAERRAVTMSREGLIDDPEILRFLNRASDLLFALARFEEAARGRRAPPSRAR